MNNFFNRHIYGILGTIVVHLVLGIIFMLMKLSVSYRDTGKYVWIEFESPREEKALQILEQKEKVQGYDEDDYWTTIAANLSNEPEEEFDIEEYMDQLKEELIENGDIKKENNYIDERKQIKKTLEAGITSFIEDKRTEEITNRTKKTSAEIAAQYRGPTRIFYELAGRVHINLPLPIYLCEAEGKVVVDIEVDRKGIVVTSAINESETAIFNECLYEAAKKAASLSVFSTDYLAPNRQSGKITYHFAAQ
ncbi:MAG: hypothetical protein J7K53_08855 [Bacteroidales bacterium]|nr:hypothetical protein [Bacteroidales bacterium]